MSQLQRGTIRSWTVRGAGRGLALGCIGALVLGACGGEQLDLAGKGEPIVNGIKLNNKQYRSLMALFIGTGMCSGAAVSETAILTAAHCVVPFDSEGRITQKLRIRKGSRIGISNVGQIKGAGAVKTVTVTQVAVHWSWRKNCPGNAGCVVGRKLFDQKRVDIALIRIQGKLSKILPQLRPAKIRLGVVAANTIIDQTGYGLDENDLAVDGSDGVIFRRRAREKALWPSVALAYHNKIMTQVKLAKGDLNYFRSVFKTYLLTDGFGLRSAANWGKNKGKDDGTFFGDSGGPVFLSTNQAQIVGVIHGGIAKTPSGAKLPQLSTVNYSTRTSSAANWLKKNLHASRLIAP